MIDKLTPEQESRIASERKRYFDLATSIEPADRPQAEAAVRELAEIAGVKVSAVVWVNNPDDGAKAHDAAWASLRASLRVSLGASLRDSLWASLRDSLWASLRDSLWASLGASLGASLRDSLWASLRDSLWASLRDSLRDSLWASLRDSLWASLGDTGWVSYYAVPRDLLGVTYAQDASRKLDLWISTLGSCFAVWIVPGTAILCERPASVEIVDGRLIGVTWRTA